MSLLDSIQSLCLKIILRKKQYTMLHLLIQFYCLADNVETAEVLIKLGMKDKSKFKGKCSFSKTLFYNLIGSVENPLIGFADQDYLPELFQLGIDMLHRQKKFRAIINHFFSVGKVVDAMEFCKRRAFEGIDPKWFLDYACEIKDKTLFNALVDFFLNVS